MPKVELKDIIIAIERLERDLRKLKRQVNALEIKPEHEDLPGEEGVFDGVYMILDNGEKIEVPENYAAKSRLVYGDRLKKVIMDGKDKYKQIVKVSRKEVEGIVTRKEGVWHVLTEYGSHTISKNAAEYNKVEINDQVLVILPEKNPSVPFAALERVLRDDKKISTITDDSSKKELSKDGEEIELKKEKPKTKKKESKKTSTKEAKNETKKEKKSESKQPKKENKEKVEEVTTIDDDDDLR